MKLKILTYPDPKLKKPSSPVTDFNQEVSDFIDDLLEKLYSDDNNVGLAAPQVGRHQRIIAIDVSDERNKPICLINPEITSKEGVFKGMEACLSLPGAYEEIERSAQVEFTALDRNGKQFSMQVDGILAECVQHEIDHLDGILFIDRLSPLRRKRAVARMKKYQNAKRM